MSSSASRRERAAQEKAAKKLDREPIILQFDFGTGNLRYHGPIITTNLTITEDHRQALLNAGATIPPPVSCRFLVDTGADGCVVKHDVALQAGLKLINANLPIHGVGVDTTGKAYIGRVVFGVESRVVTGSFH